MKDLKFLLKEKWKSPLHTALALTGILNASLHARLHTAAGEISFEKKMDGLISESMRTLRVYAENDTWKPEPLYIESISKKETIYSGSAALTAACAAESIALFLDTKLSPKNVSGLTKKYNDDHKSIPTLVLKKAADFLASKSKPLQDQALPLIQRTVEKDLAIIMLPFIFYEALSKSATSKFECHTDGTTKEILTELALANLFGWIAYTIYDNILDGDTEAQPTLLPLAHLLLRHTASIYHDTLSPEQRKTCTDILNGIDEANIWEQKNCLVTIKENHLIIPPQFPAFGDYTILAQKSLGHALGPISLLLKAGLGPESEAVQKRGVRNNGRERRKTT